MKFDERYILYIYKSTTKRTEQWACMAQDRRSV